MPVNGKPKLTKTQKRRRRRQNKAKAEAVAPKVPRPPNRAIVPRMMSKVERDYFHCRTDPFSSTSGVGIPDSSGGSRVVMDHRHFYDVTIGSSGGFIGRLVPTASVPVWLKDYATSPATGVVVNGHTCSGVLQGIGKAGGWLALPVSDWAQWAIVADPASTTDVVNPFYATRARIVSQAARFTYTGAVLNGAGTITVNPGNMFCDGLTLNDIGIQSYSPTSVASTAYGAESVNQITLATTFTSTAINGTVMHRAVAGTQVLNKRLAPLAEWVAISGRPIVPCDTNAGIAAMANLSDVAYPTLPFIDTNWGSPTFIVSGMAQGTSMRIEVVVCVEYQLEPASILARMATDRPKLSANTLVSLDEKISKLPIAGSPTFFQSLAPLLSRAAGVLGTVAGGPAIGAAADTITTALTNLFI